MLLFCLLCRLSISLAAKEYGIVYPTLLSARGSDEAKVLKINDHLTLNLKRSEVFSDNFMFISEENGERIHVPLRKEDYEKDLYHDEESMASLIVRTEDGVTAEGVINPTLRIKPLLEMGRSESGEIPHKLFEMPPETSEPPKHRDYKVANITAREDGFTDFLEERSTHSTLYPELHIVQDYAHARQFGFRKTDVIIYFGVFINAVNVMYKKNHSPKIQLRIAAITMSTQEEQYFYYADQNREQILDEQTLARFNEHYKTNVEFQTTDLTFLVTGLDMVFYENGVLQTWVGGYTYIGGFCQESKVGMSEDPPGSYYGVIVFAHEVGHSLGCVHDGDGAVAEVPGHKGSANCHWDQGYLMSYVRKNSNQFRFSPCCLADIKNVLSHQEWGCLRNRSRKSIKHPGYPGQYISGEEYCQRCYPHIRGVHYDKKRGVVDCKVRCGSSAGDSVLIGVPDGAPCDAERRGRKRCFLAKCRTMHSD